MVMVMYSNNYEHYYLLGKHYYNDVKKHQKGTTK